MVVGKGDEIFSLLHRANYGAHCAALGSPAAEAGATNPLDALQALILKRLRLCDCYLFSSCSRNILLR
jgi:hypothetical protein